MPPFWTSAMIPAQGKSFIMRTGPKQWMQTNLCYLSCPLSSLPLCRSPFVNIKKQHSPWELYSSKCHVCLNSPLLYLKNLRLLVLEKLIQSDHTRPAYFEYFMTHTVSNCAWELFGTDLFDPGKNDFRDYYNNLMPQRIMFQY